MDINGTRNSTQAIGNLHIFRWVRSIWKWFSVQGSSPIETVSLRFRRLLLISIFMAVISSLPNVVEYRTLFLLPWFSFAAYLILSGWDQVDTTNMSVSNELSVQKNMLSSVSLSAIAGILASSLFNAEFLQPLDFFGVPIISFGGLALIMYARRNYEASKLFQIVGWSYVVLWLFAADMQAYGVVVSGSQELWSTDSDMAFVAGVVRMAGVMLIDMLCLTLPRKPSTTIFSLIVFNSLVVLGIITSPQISADARYYYLSTYTLWHVFIIPIIAVFAIRRDNLATRLVNAIDLLEDEVEVRIRELREAKNKSNILYETGKAINQASSPFEIVHGIKKSLPNPYEVHLFSYENFDAATATYTRVAANTYLTAEYIEALPESMRMMPLRRDVGFTITDREDQSSDLYEHLSKKRVTSNNPFANADTLPGDQSRIFIADVTELDLSPEELSGYTMIGITSVALCTLVIEGRVIGALGFASDKPVTFSDYETGLLRAIADMTASAFERLRLLNEAHVARDEALQANRVKSAFLASMSHELRTPLNAIINFSKFMGKEIPGPLNDEQHELISGVASSGQHLLNLINDVLDMSKIESGSLKLYIEPAVDMQEIVQTALIYTKPLLQEKPVEMRLELPEVMPVLAGDRKRLLQIMINILSNACKFTDEGYVRVLARITDDNLLLSVEDTGMGIAEQDSENVFTAFKQTSSGLRQGGGTGLGMPICKKLVEAHEGRMWFESKLGKGTTFFVELPLQSSLVPERFGQL
jgi:signal transduction histidine kinase